jgi:site-specific recombinase XerD
MGHSGTSGARDLLVSMRSRLSERRLSDRVEKAWLYWARGLLMAHPDRAPESINADDVRGYVHSLADGRYKSKAAQWQVTQACVFLLRNVAGVDDPELDALLEAARPARKPSILSPPEVQSLLAELSGTSWLMASLSYGAGLRLMECVRLRVRDLKGNRIVVCDISGRASRETVLPERVRETMAAHLEQLKLQHIRELADGFGGVQLPLAMRASASMSRSWSWQFLFPGPYMQGSAGPGSGALRGHITEPEIRQAIEQAARMAGLEKPVAENTLRNSFAAHLLQRGVALCDVEKLLGINDQERGRSVGQERAPDVPVPAKRRSI